MEYIQNKNYLYLLGLLWADGYMGKYYTVLDINRTDGEEIMKRIPDIKHSVYYMHRKPYKKSMIIHFKDKLFNSFLKQNGYQVNRLNPNKILDQIDKDKIKYWLLGYLDGDGCIYTNIKNKCFQLTFASSIKQKWDFLVQFCNEHKIKYSIRKAKHITVKNKIHKASYFRVVGIINMKKFLDVVYKNNVGLSRKYNKYKEALDYIQNNKPPKVCKLLQKQTPD